jgi:S1-C subfamily serine protease
LGIVACLVLVATTAAQTTQPSSILSQISDESQKLFQQVQPSLVTVQMPSPRWLTLMMEQNDPLHRWDGKIDPALQRRLMQQQATANLGPGTQPTTQSTGDRQVETPPRYLGLVINQEGFVVVPMFVERETVVDQPINVVVSGQPVRAKYVGADRKTNLTVLKLEESAGKSADLGGKPALGSLVMALNANGESGQLLLWTGGMEENTVVVSVDGKIAGFSRGGQFLSGDNSKVVIDQIIRFGGVKRATLGVWLQGFVRPDGSSGVGIAKVLEDSPAAKGGLVAGDVILTLNGQPMTDVPTFAAAIAAGKGATPIDVFRDGKIVHCIVVLAQEP